MLWFIISLHINNNIIKQQLDLALFTFKSFRHYMFYFIFNIKTRQESRIMKHFLEVHNICIIDLTNYQQVNNIIIMVI
jgi:hypothetical protein